MPKWILGILLALVVGYLLYLGYERYRDRADESGAIHGDGISTSDTADNSVKPAEQPRATPTQAVAQPAVQPLQTNGTAPASDSIAPNPPNGMTFGGSGKFQVYRQGNLTWRVDTESGHACVLFATMEEWRKPIVYSHGCNNS